MELLLLGIYAFFAWLVFFKFKWLPCNFVTQVVTITIPIVALTILILVLNIVAPSSPDIRVVNYVVPINPPVRGLVTEVPIEPNRPIKKGDVLFKIDPVPYQISVQNFEAQLAQLRESLAYYENTGAALASTLRDDAQRAYTAGEADYFQFTQGIEQAFQLNAEHLRVRYELAITVLHLRALNGL